MLDVTRRRFLGSLGVVAMSAAALFGGVKTLGFLFPSAPVEEPRLFKVDVDPALITIGNPLQITSKRVSIVRDAGGLYAVQLICTHLGCTPNYVTNVTNGTGVADVVAAARGRRSGADAIGNGWACPCHGSRYFIDSTNFYGPAPRPMDWVDLQLAPDGKLLVDRAKLVVQRGAGDTTVPEWRLDPTTGKNNGRTYGV